MHGANAPFEGGHSLALVPLGPRGFPEIRTDGDSAWIAAGWRSEATGPDGKPFTRPGRATFILSRRDGRWLCVHSHVSLQPTQSESAHGRLGA
jgi:ketosteroid isomerase-like protein